MKTFEHLLVRKKFVNPYIEAHRDNLFHPDDKAWMTERKKEWRFIKANLKQFYYVKNKYHKQIKHWFFYGKSMDDANPITPFGDLGLAFYLWFWPEKSLDAYCAILKEERHRWGGGRNALERIVNHFQTDFPGDYGMFGGREEMMLQAFMPYLDWKQPLPSTSTVHTFYGLHPATTIKTCIGQTYQLMVGIYINPYAPGQYLWDHFDYGFNHYLELCELDEIWEKNTVNLLKSLMRLMLNFYDREGTFRENPAVVKLRDTLVKRFEEGGFCGSVMTLWQEQKQAHANNEPIKLFHSVKYVENQKRP